MMIRSTNTFLFNFLGRDFMKSFISFSGGVESSTMCVLFGNKADAIFADTGFEHIEIYDRLELIEKWGKVFHRPDFKIHKVKNEIFVENRRRGRIWDHDHRSGFF